MLAKTKLKSIETLLPQALIDLEISHEEFKTIVNKKEKYEQMKYSVRNTKNKDESSENSKKIAKMYRFKKHDSWTPVRANKDRINSDNDQIRKKSITK